MHPYYPRCLIDDAPTLIALGVTLGALVQHTDDTGRTITAATDGGAWDEIGPIYRRTGGTNDEPVHEPLTDPSGAVYWHANLLTPVNLRERAQALAAERPEIAAALVDLGRWFMLDEHGNARAPAMPHRVFAGMEP